MKCLGSGMDALNVTGIIGLFIYGKLAGNENSINLCKMGSFRNIIGFFRRVYTRDVSLVQVPYFVKKSRTRQSTKRREKIVSLNINLGKMRCSNTFAINSLLFVFALFLFTLNMYITSMRKMM